MRISDWSSDVCSSDLEEQRLRTHRGGVLGGLGDGNQRIDRCDDEKTHDEPWQAERNARLGLGSAAAAEPQRDEHQHRGEESDARQLDDRRDLACALGKGKADARTEEGRGGNEDVSTCRTRRGTDNEKKKQNKQK